jgi:hypothetical protein
MPAEYGRPFVGPLIDRSAPDVLTEKGGNRPFACGACAP